MQLSRLALIFIYCSVVWAAARPDDDGAVKAPISAQYASITIKSTTKLLATAVKSSTTNDKPSSTTTTRSRLNNESGVEIVVSKIAPTTTSEIQRSKKTQAASKSVASKGQMSTTKLSRDGQMSSTPRSILSSKSTSGISSKDKPSSALASASATASAEDKKTSTPSITSEPTESASTFATQISPGVTSPPMTDTTKTSSYTRQTPSSIMSSKESALPTNRTTVDTQGEIKHCLPGSQCGLTLGIVLSFSCVFLIAGFFVVGRKYRSFLVVSQKSHKEKWHSRGGDGQEEYYALEGGEDLKIMSVSPAETLPPQYVRSDELFLPEVVQRVVNRVSKVQMQHQRLSPETYGSVTRKPLASIS